MFFLDSCGKRKKWRTLCEGAAKNFWLVTTNKTEFFCPLFNPNIKFEFDVLVFALHASWNSRWSLLRQPNARFFVSRLVLRLAQSHFTHLTQMFRRAAINIKRNYSELKSKNVFARVRFFHLMCSISTSSDTINESFIIVQNWVTPVKRILPKPEMIGTPQLVECTFAFVFSLHR